MATFGIKRVIDADYDEVLARVPEALKREGFGVLTEIDVRETLKKKLDVDFRRYKILGACNPPFAHRALTAETDIGLLLPCNVVVYEVDGGKTVVAAVDPMLTIEAVAASGLEAQARGELSEIARAVREKLTRAVESV